MRIRVYYLEDAEIISESFYQALIREAEKFDPALDNYDEVRLINAFDWSNNSILKSHSFWSKLFEVGMELEDLKEQLPQFFLSGEIVEKTNGLWE